MGKTGKVTKDREGMDKEGKGRQGVKGEGWDGQR